MRLQSRAGEVDYERRGPDACAAKPKKGPDMAEPRADLGLIGLAVMGRNLVLNMSDHGFTVAVCNRTAGKVDDFLAGEARGRSIFGAHGLEEFISLLRRPRRVMLLVKAGPPVDAFLERLIPLLAEGDIIIDGGNSHYRDTIRRGRAVEAEGLLYVGMGVSGGEAGARHGPSLMPGGSPAAWPRIKDIFQAVAAKVADPQTGREEPCCDWVGPDGAGHFVKMVHNGIEYGDMQLIGEAYHLMGAAGLTPAEMSDVFAEWSRGELDSYLIEITRDILAKTDDETGRPMVDVILDAAGQKGTGKWTGIAALDLGQPLTLIGEAVFARCLSAMKDRRVAASEKLRGPKGKPIADPARRASFVEDVRAALYASKIVSYAQGCQLMQAAAAEYGWELDLGGIALMWRGGCIIRSQFLERIGDAYATRKPPENLLLSAYFKSAVRKAQSAWRRTVKRAVTMGVPTPALSSALAYFDGYRNARLPANLLQAQRDYFGAHTYERVDRPRGEFFHTNWTGQGGDVTAGAYNT
jgi:6-phosphogluconate dehydrogenase